MKNKLVGILSLLLATVIWGGAFVAQSAGMDHVGPFTFQAIRCALAVAAMIAVSLLLELRQLKEYFKKWADPKLWKTGLLCGAALFVATGLQQVGLVYTDAGKAGFITAMYIVMVPIIGLFLRKKPTIMVFISILIAVIGMYLLCGTGVGGINIGDLLLIGCSIAFAVQITLVDRFAAELDCVRLNCIQAGVVSLLSIPFIAFTETIDGNLILSCWLPLCYAGILSMGAGYALQIVGQKRVEPNAASLIMSLESVFALVFGTLILHETLTVTEAIGCALVFIAVILSQLPTQIIKSLLKIAVLVLALLILAASITLGILCLIGLYAFSTDPTTTGFDYLSIGIIYLYWGIYAFLPGIVFSALSLWLHKTKWVKVTMYAMIVLFCIAIIPLVFILLIFMAAP